MFDSGRLTTNNKGMQMSLDNKMAINTTIVVFGIYKSRSPQTPTDVDWAIKSFNRYNFFTNMITLPTDPQPPPLRLTSIQESCDMSFYPDRLEISFMPSQEFPVTMLEYIIMTAKFSFITKIGVISKIVYYNISKPDEVSVKSKIFSNSYIKKLETANEWTCKGHRLTLVGSHTLNLGTTIIYGDGQASVKDKSYTGKLIYFEIDINNIDIRENINPSEMLKEMPHLIMSEISDFERF